MKTALTYPARLGQVAAQAINAGPARRSTGPRMRLRITPGRTATTAFRFFRRQPLESRSWSRSLISRTHREQLGQIGRVPSVCSGIFMLKRHFGHCRKTSCRFLVADLDLYGFVAFKYSSNCTYYAP
jgi:hypothetical protein